MRTLGRENGQFTKMQPRRLEDTKAICTTSLRVFVTSWPIDEFLCVLRVLCGECKTLINREAVDKAGAARRHEILLTAAPARMRRVPGAVAAALLVRMPDLRRSH